MHRNGYLHRYYYPVETGSPFFMMKGNLFLNVFLNILLIKLAQKSEKNQVRDLSQVFDYQPFKRNKSSKNLIY
ncbi:hypothetical protein BpHYR1_046292 [Brachionus plicatilis]|uniref:Uncharacterized protein n=1 Tax=Brachionus plicatilis TaxID=10195 RepID=A0A3M7RYA9_BRAPC|nr:hypothetical protein BpHYR1_046292 [Brachionus plicatilis]